MRRLPILLAPVALLFVVAMLPLHGCSGTSACESDADCKGDRICRAGACSDPGGGGGGQGGGGATGGGDSGLDNGEPCDTAGQCQSGFCVEGVCCSDACEGPCDSCRQSGVCMADAVGEPGSPSCAPYLCDGSSDCATSCVDDEDCVNGFFCDAGSCAPLGDIGNACADDSGCLLGNCVDGVCCNDPCEGACDVCSMALGAGVDGACTVLPVGAPGDPSCTPYLCDGLNDECPSDCDSDGDCATGICLSGSCAPPLGNGNPCTSDGQCASGLCVDDVCCESACAAECESCSLATNGVADGTCSSSINGAQCTPSDLCIVSSTCQGGLCSGTIKDCTFEPVPNECHISVCNPMTGSCEPEFGNSGLPCVDQMDLCTLGKSCNTTGMCVGGTPKDCSHLNIVGTCTVGGCNSGDGLCEQQTLPGGSVCDDFDGCTLGTICTGNVCGAGTVITACINADGCCPGGCDQSNDSDCVLDVLLLWEDFSGGAADLATYQAALTAAGVVTWTEFETAFGVFPTAAFLNTFDTIVAADELFSSWSNAAAQDVANWLQTGDRNLFVTSVDYLADFATAPGGSGEHNLFSLWGISYAGSSSGTGIASILGTSSDPIGGAFVAGLSLSMTSDGSGDYVDATVGPATMAGLYGPGGTGANMGALTHYNTGTYKVVWLGVNFHNGLTSQAQRDTLMTNIMDFFR